MAKNQFTPEIDEVILELRRDRRSWVDIAQAVKLPLANVTKRYRELTAQPSSIKPNQWSAHEDELLLSGLKLDFSYQEIVERWLPGRTAVAAQSRANQLRLLAHVRQETDCAPRFERQMTEAEWREHCELASAAYHRAMTSFYERRAERLREAA